MKCEENFDLFASVGGGRKPCDRDARWAVRVNPPTNENDGTVKLCDFHNSVDYVGFDRQPLGES